MLEVSGPPRAPDIREALRTSQSITEANSYRTREVVDITVNGSVGKWHSLKGGVTPHRKESSTESGNVSYEIFFNPTTNSWLKIVRPEAKKSGLYERFETRLRKSAQQQRTALEVAGLPKLASQIKDTEVEIKGQKVYGFTSPHIGPTLEFILYKITGHRKGRKLPTDAVDFFSYVYSIASDQAEKLYLDFGVWTSDPNPGNILLHQAEDGIHVVLIDFSNSEQQQDNIFSHVPKDRFEPEAYLSKIKDMLMRRVKRLHRRLEEHCNERGVPFIRNPQEVEANIQRSPAYISASKK